MTFHRLETFACCRKFIHGEENNDDE